MRYKVKELPVWKTRNVFFITEGAFCSLPHLIYASFVIIENCSYLFERERETEEAPLASLHFQSKAVMKGYTQCKFML